MVQPRSKPGVSTIFFEQVKCLGSVRKKGQGLKIQMLNNLCAFSEVFSAKCSIGILRSSAINAEDLREVVRWIPLERLLLETDSPFLAPVPFRGKPNKPVHIPVIASFIAELRRIPIEHLAEKTSENAHRLFSI
jgi:Tat protein secretion system quality control protein TatD with DNase activity